MSRGHAAALPPSGWRPPDRVSADGLVVRFLPEDGGVERAFRFGDLPVSPELCRAFATAFATLTAPDGTHRSASTAEGTHEALRRFSRRLAESPRPPRTAGDLVPAHLTEVRLAKPRDYIRLKVILRDVPGLTPAFAGALREANPSRRSQPIASLTKAEFNTVMTAARSDLRGARARIRSNRELLRRWRSGEVEPGSEDAARAIVLDHVATCGDVPREDGKVPDWVAALGTVAQWTCSLHLTSREVLAAAVLLAGMTGHNATGISNLTVEHTRADGADSDGRIRVAIVDVTKPRRGRRRRYMTTPLADIPASVLADGDTRTNDLSTPFGVFAAVCDLTSHSRRCTDSNRLLLYPATKGGHGVGRHWVYGIQSGGPLKGWAADHDLRSESDPGKPLILTWPRLRLSYVRLHQRGVAHTDSVLVNQYLLRDRGNINEYRQLVADTLRQEEAKAREFGRIHTLTDEDVAQAGTDPTGVGDRAGIDADTLHGLIEGKLDTALAGCVDEIRSPFSAPDAPCTASFLLCLRCPNARATPAHLPAQALAHRRILDLRPAMPPDRWARRFGAAEAQLRHLLDQYPPARVADALAAATPAHRDMIERLLNGGLDSR